MSINTLFHTAKPVFKALFPLRLRYLQNHIFIRFDGFIGCWKSLTPKFFLGIREQYGVTRCPVRNVRRMTHGVQVFLLKIINRPFGRVWAGTVMVQDDAPFSIGLADFTDSFGRTNCCIPISIHGSAIIQSHSSHMSRLSKERGDHFLCGAAPTNHFGRIELVSKHPNGYLLLRFRVLAVDSCFVTCYDIPCQIWRSSVESVKRSLASSHSSVFLGPCRIMWDPPLTQLLHHQMIMQKRMYLTHGYAQGCLKLAVFRKPACFDHAAHSIDVFWGNNGGRTTFTVTVLKATSSALKFYKSAQNRGKG